MHIDSLTYTPPFAYIYITELLSDNPMPLIYSFKKISKCLMQYIRTEVIDTKQKVPVKYGVNSSQIGATVDEHSSREVRKI